MFSRAPGRAPGLLRGGPQGSRALREGIEQARNELRRYARAVVFTGDTDPVA